MSAREVMADHLERIARFNPTLNAIVLAQTSVIRMQTALMQNYQNLMTVSQTPAPPTGP